MSDFQQLIFNKKKHHFNDISIIPKSKGIYAAWILNNKKYDLIYIGKATNSRNGTLYNRIKKHYSGQRGSDQFCLYLFDNLINIKNDCIDGTNLTPIYNKITQNWSRKNILFSYICLKEQDNEHTIEQNLIKTLNPILNSGPFEILCQLGKIKNTKGHEYENRDRCRAIC